MLQLYSWAQDKISSAASYLYAPVDKLTQIATNVMSVNVNDYINVTSFWHGFSRITDLSWVGELLIPSKTREILGQSFSANLLCYLGSTLLYETVIKRFLHFIPDMENSKTELAIDFIANGYLISLCLRNMVSNIIYSNLLAKYTSEEHPHP